MPGDGRSRQAVAAIESRLSDAGRKPFVAGIAGPPGAGKTTLAEAVAAELSRAPGRRVLALQMDGFHLPDSELDRRGLRAVKGREDTFDADAFVAMLGRVRAGEGGYHWPVFLREIEASSPDGVPVAAGTDIVVLEGNYLLLDRGAWRAVRPLLDLALFIDAPEAVLLERLMRRHREGGRTEPEARAKVEGTDLPNMRLIRGTAGRADLMLDDPPRAPWRPSR